MYLLKSTNPMAIISHREQCGTVSLHSLKNDEHDVGGIKLMKLFKSS